MAESAVSTHPVPKPRVSRAHPHQTQTTPEPDRPSADEELSSDPPSYVSLLSPNQPSPTASPTTDPEQEDTDEPAVVLRKRPIPRALSPNDDEDDYENIDAHLGSEVQENMRRSDYINWVYIDSDGEEHEGGVGKIESSLGIGKVHDRYAPSIKLDRHPALKKSQSNSDISTSDFVDGVRKQRPKNRAPPPPPGAKPSRDKSKPVSSAISDHTRHKRSQSDLHLSGYSQTSSEQTRQDTVYEQGRVLHKPPPSRPAPPMVGGGQSSKATPTHYKAGGRLSPSQRGGAEPGYRGARSNQKSPESSRRDSKERSTPLKVHNEDNSPRSDKIYSRLTSQDKQKDAVKPKRHAPPPPAAVKNKKSGGSSPEGEIKRGDTPEYAVVNKQRLRGGGDQSDPTSRRWSRTGSGDRLSDSIGPPKPIRTRRTQSIEDLSRLANQTPVCNAERLGPQTGQKSVLNSMDIFTIQLRKDREVSFGLVIVSGKARSADEDQVLEGVFVQKVIPHSPADNDGRIQSGDMLIEVGRKDLVGGSLDKAIELLKDANESIRLKIGRPDVSSSLLTMDGDDEQPIYENELLPPAEMLLKLEQAENKVFELEGEREKALEDLISIRRETDQERTTLRQQLEELKVKLEESKSESDARNSELTQALASVTVGRTKTEQQLDSLKEELALAKDKLRHAQDSNTGNEELETKLRAVERERDSLREENVFLKSELDREKINSTQLQEKLDIAESAKDSESEEVLTLQETIKSQTEQISSQRADLEQLRNLRTTPLRKPHQTAENEPHNLTNGDVHHSSNLLDTSDDSGDDSDNAFDERVPSPVTPSPYLDFVPLEEKGNKGKKEDKPTEDSKVESITDKDVVNETSNEHEKTPPASLEDTDPQPNTEDPGALASAEFDAVEVQTEPLNMSAALHKTQVGGRLRRSKPSRDHLRTMGSSSNLLDTLPETNTIDPSPVVQPVEPSVSVSTPPMPKPRARRRVQPSPSVEETKPHAAPRHKLEDGHDTHLTQENDQSTSDIKEEVSESVSNKKKPIVPSPKASPAHSIVKSSPERSIPSSLESPQMKKKEPLFPSPKPSPNHSPKQLPKLPPHKDLSHEEKPIDTHPPKPQPRQSKQHSLEEPIMLDVPITDHVHSNNTSVSSAPSSPIKIKLPPPPVPRKPKPGEEHHGEGSNHEGSPFRRTNSLDNELEASPRHKMKLPPGAINLLGLLPPSVNLRPQERERSCTVSTTEPGAREKNTLKRHLNVDQSHIEPVSTHEEVDSGEVVKVPPKRPPPPKKPQSDQSDRYDAQGSSDDLDSDASPMVVPKRDHGISNPTSSELDYNEVLFWSADLVGTWVKRIGLEKYQQIFMERNIQGYMLFDLDGHRLKGMGMETHDDRGIFKREVKNLKPYADKQKKAIEKQKKEEKKNAKKKKK